MGHPFLLYIIIRWKDRNTGKRALPFKHSKTSFLLITIYFTLRNTPGPEELATLVHYISFSGHSIPLYIMIRHLTSSIKGSYGQIFMDKISYSSRESMDMVVYGRINISYQEITV